MPELEQKEPALLFFYEMQPGDIAKYKTKSNIAQTGGGARDLRPRPAGEVSRVLRPMFPRTTDKAGAFEGTIHWFDDDGNVQSEDICLWTIYEARQGEARIGTSYKIGAWAISEDEYQAAQARGKKWFYVLLMDKDDVTWAYVMREEDLEDWSPEVRDYVRGRVAATPQGARPRHVIGSINFVSKEEYP